MTNFKSPKTSKRVVFASIAISRPRISAWYSATLFEQHYVRVNAYGSTSPSRFTKTTLAPAPLH